MSTPTRFLRGRLTRTALALALCLSLSACARWTAKVSVVPATGTIRIAGQPAEGAKIFLIPVASKPDSFSPSAVTDREGRYELRLYRNTPGIPPGEYVACITWPGPPSEDNRRRSASDLLQGRYSSPRTSPLRVTVAAGIAELPPFEL